MATKLREEGEDSDESGSQAEESEGDEYSDECSEDSEICADEVGAPHEETEKAESAEILSKVANLEPPVQTAKQSASLPEFFDIGSMDDSAPEADEAAEPKTEAARSAEAAAAEAKAAEAAAAEAAAELEAAAAEARQKPERECLLRSCSVCGSTWVGVGSLHALS